MKTTCISVRLASFERISVKCFKAVAFDGSEALIPASQYYGPDHEVSKSEAYWISEWILDRIHLQHSRKKTAIFDHKTGKRLPDVHYERHVPEPLEAESPPIPEDLKK